MIFQDFSTSYRALYIITFKGGHDMLSDYFSDLSLVMWDLAFYVSEVPY